MEINWKKTASELAEETISYYLFTNALFNKTNAFRLSVNEWKRHLECMDKNTPVIVLTKHGDKIEFEVNHKYTKTLEIIAILEEKLK